MNFRKILSLLAAVSLGIGGTACGEKKSKSDKAELINDTEPAVKVVQIAAGGSFMAALTENGKLYTWGSNDKGQLGAGMITNGDRIQEPVEIMENVSDVAVGSVHGAAITEDGKLYTWGSNEWGQLGNGGNEEAGVNVPVFVMDNVKIVSCSRHLTAAITENNDLYLWGYTNVRNPQYGTTWESPVKVLSNVKEVSLGDCSFSAITNDGKLYMWGENSNREIPKSSDVPLEVTDISDVASVTMGYHFSSILKNNGDLYTWGINDENCLGTGDSKDADEPVKILEDIRFVETTNAPNSPSDPIINAAINNNNEVYVWGTSYPVPEKAFENIVSVAVEYRNGAVLTENGNVYQILWGSINNPMKVEFTE